MAEKKIDFTELPVYQQKKRILDMLSANKIIVVQSPTGSGKTTQIPIILHEAGYTSSLAVAVTQPRRIAALSVSEFIAKQLNTTYPGVVGYKMRFEDKTDSSTRIKIMTDGILLQEIKFDPFLTRYSVVMVDEAHERSLNIDFILGLLKRILVERADFKVIISSATMNAEAFSHYFDGAPIVTIDTVTYPVNVVYDPLEPRPESPAVGEKSSEKPPARKSKSPADELILLKIQQTIERVIQNKTTGAALCFLPGEKAIRDCIFRLKNSSISRKIHALPLYGRLSKEEQEQVFHPAPPGKIKIIVATNIAETSVTIPDVRTVIDSGLAKLNFYNPRTFTSSLTEALVSKASCAQRKGRAGRTAPGTCYRLYARQDFDARPLYTTEEIYRTDLSEVVLRMAELGITDFEDFDFIAPPGKAGIRGAVETLDSLGALNDDRTLSRTGLLMAEFPLLPRQSRIIVEAILRYPDVITEALTATAFLSAKSPFILPQGEEMDARKAHHSFRGENGDFGSYLKLFETYAAQKNRQMFCEKFYLDPEVMGEIFNIKEQLEQIVSRLGVPVTSGGAFDDYLCCIAAGMIQFVCVREGKESYKSVTEGRIRIHPGSSMFRENPRYIVAGEIVRTSRMFAMSVSPLSKKLLERIDPRLLKNLNSLSVRQGRGEEKSADGLFEEPAGRPPKAPRGKKRDGQKTASAPALSAKAAPFSVTKKKYRSANPGNLQELLNALKMILRPCPLRDKGKTTGFIALATDGRGNYRLKPLKTLSSALSESLSALEILVDDSESFSAAQKNAAGEAYRKLSEYAVK
jgi:RNA helicase HrpA